VPGAGAAADGQGAGLVLCAGACCTGGCGCWPCVGHGAGCCCPWNPGCTLICGGWFAAVAGFGTLLFGIGLLVTGPLYALTLAVLYRDLFLNPYSPTWSKSYKSYDSESP